jgi:hypothetical protein
VLAGSVVEGLEDEGVERADDEVEAEEGLMWLIVPSRGGEKKARAEREERS